MERQTTFSDFEYANRKRTTKREEFLKTMDEVIPWRELVACIRPHYPSGKRGRPPRGIEPMLRMYLLQVWFNLSDEAVEDSIYDSYAMRSFVGLNFLEEQTPDATTLLHFRHLLERHGLGKKLFEKINALLEERGCMMRGGTIVDATIISAPSSTKNQDGERDPEMHQTKKGNQWHFGMKAHIGVDADSGLVHTVATTAANAHDITQAHALLHGEEDVVFADSGYRGVEKRDEVQELHPDSCWHIAMMPGKRKALDKSKALDALIDQLETIKARIRAKVEHPFRVIKCQFGHRKVRYKGLAKNTSQLLVMFALSNLWMVRKRILQGQQA